MLQAFDIAGRNLIGETVVPHIETINNVYVVSRETAERLVQTRPARHAGGPTSRPGPRAHAELINASRSGVTSCRSSGGRG